MARIRASRRELVWQKEQEKRREEEEELDRAEEEEDLRYGGQEIKKLQSKDQVKSARVS